MDSVNKASFLDKALNNMLAAGYLQGLARARQEVSQHDPRAAEALERVISAWRASNPEAAILADV